MSAALDFRHLIADKDLPKLHEAAKEVHEEQYRHVRRIKWRNKHTRRFQALTGDDKLLCGYDNDAGRWCFAQLKKRTIVEAFGVRESRMVEEVPVIWWHVEDDSQSPPAFVSINDPRLPDMVLKADRMRNPKAFENRYAAWQRQKEINEQSRRREFRDRTADLWEPYKKFCDDLGVTKAHRGTSGDGIKIWSRTGERDTDHTRRTDGSLIEMGTS